MFTRILTDLERRRVNNYLRQDGEKEAPIRKIANRARNHLPKIKGDLELLERLLATYEHEKAAG
jgi:23S rRNA maturation-related 3'-5' exoribonuclease YhaM